MVQSAIFQQQFINLMSLSCIFRQKNSQTRQQAIKLALSIVSQTISLMINKIYETYQKFSLQLNIDKRHLQKMVTSMVLPVQLGMYIPENGTIFQKKDNFLYKQNLKKQGEKINQIKEGKVKSRKKVGFYKEKDLLWKRQEDFSDSSDFHKKDNLFFQEEESSVFDQIPKLKKRGKVKKQQKVQNEYYQPEYQQNAKPFGQDNFLHYHQASPQKLDISEDQNAKTNNKNKKVHWKKRDAWLTAQQQIQLKNWIIEQKKNGRAASKSAVQQIAKKISSKIDFQASQHWLRHYLNRHNLRQYVLQYKNFCGMKKQKFGRLKLWSENDQVEQYFQQKKRQILQKDKRSKQKICKNEQHINQITQGVNAVPYRVNHSKRQLEDIEEQKKNNIQKYLQ